MPRPPRIDLPGIAQHVIQRGNDRRPCFFAKIDYVRYLQDLRDIARREGCAVHAYVLMTNHVHLLMSPAAPGGVARTMQALGRRYVGTSTTATAEPEPFGKAATRHASSAMTVTCCSVIATLTSTRYAHAWSPTQLTTPGQVTAALLWTSPTRC